MINESIDAPLTQLHGRYGEKLTLVVPQSLQEILSGVFVAVKDFDVSLTGSARKDGVDLQLPEGAQMPRERGARRVRLQGLDHRPVRHHHGRLEGPLQSVS